MKMTSVRNRTLHQELESKSYAWKANLPMIFVAKLGFLKAVNIPFINLAPVVDHARQEVGDLLI